MAEIAEEAFARLFWLNWFRSLAMNDTRSWPPRAILPFLLNFTSSVEDFNKSFVENFSRNFSNHNPGGTVELKSEWVISAKYWLDGPIGFSLAFVGLILNAIAICMLAKQRVQRTFHTLMMYLSCWDFGYLFFSQFLFALPVLSQDFRDSIYIRTVPYFIPLAQICLSGSCFTTVALTVERYIAICAPFFRMKYGIKAIAYMLPILLFVPIYNIPRFFEFQSYENVTYICTDGMAENYTKADLMMAKLVISEEKFEKRYQLGYNCTDWHQRTLLVLDVTETRKNKHYISIYVNFVNYFVNLAFPIFTLCILNFFIYQALRKNLAPEVRRNQNQQAENALRKRDIRLTRISIVIVVVFIVCHVPRFIPNFSEFILGKLTEPFQALISLNNLLQIVNSTVNYAIYFGSCWQFRKSEKSSHNARMLQQMEMRPIMRHQSTEEKPFVEVLNHQSEDGIATIDSPGSDSCVFKTSLCRQTFV